MFELDAFSIEMLTKSKNTFINKELITVTKFHGRMALFFTILNSKVPLPLMPHAEFQHTYMNLLYLLLLAMAAFMHQVQFETIGAKVSEKHSFSKLFSIVDRQWLLKDIQPTLDALI